MKFIVPVVCLAISSFCQAAEKPNVSAMPISNRVIQGEMTLSNGEILKFKALEGSLVTVQGEDVGSFAISGEILNEAARQVRFTVFEIKDFGQGQHGLNQLEQVEVRDGVIGSAYQVHIPNLAVSKIERSDKVSEEDIRAFREVTIAEMTGNKAATALSGTVIEQAGGSCCVTCGSTTACGCSVSMSCGSCCAGTCCPGGGGKDPQNRD